MFRKLFVVASSVAVVFVFQNFTTFKDIKIAVVKGHRLLFVSSDKGEMIRETRTIVSDSFERKSTYSSSFNGGTRWTKSPTFKPPVSAWSYDDISLSGDGEHVVIVESVFNVSNSAKSIRVHVSHDHGEHWKTTQNFPKYATSSLNVGGIRDESRQVLISDDGRYLLVNSSFVTSYATGDADVMNNLFFSADGGNSWRRIESAPKDVLVKTIFLANDNKSIFFSGIVFKNDQQDNFLFASFNRGGEWVKTHLGISAVQEQLSVMPAVTGGYSITKRTKKSIPPKIIFSEDGKKIYVNFNEEATGRGSISTNSGKSFKKLVQQPKTAAGAFVGETQLVLLAQRDERNTLVSVSEDNGQLWNKKTFKNAQKELWLATPKVQSRGQALYVSIYAIAELDDPMLYYYMILE